MLGIIVFCLVLWFVFRILKSRDSVSDTSLREVSRLRISDLNRDVRADLALFTSDPVDHFLYTRMKNATLSDRFRDVLSAYYFLFLMDKDKTDKQIYLEVQKHVEKLAKSLEKEKNQDQNEFSTALMILRVKQVAELTDLASSAISKLKGVKDQKQTPVNDPLNILDAGVSEHIHTSVQTLLGLYRFTFLNADMQESLFLDIQKFIDPLQNRSLLKDAVRLIKRHPVQWDDRVTDWDILCLLWIWSDEPRHFALGNPMKQSLLATLASCQVKGTNEWKWGVRCRVTHLVCSVAGFVAKDDSHILGQGPCLSWQDKSNSLSLV